jgi:hypothetical protein
MLLRTGFPSPWHAYSHQTSVHGGYRPCFVQVLHFRPSECSSQFSIFFFCFLDAFAKLGKRLLAPSGLSVSLSVRPSVHHSVCLSVCPHGTIRLSLDGFWLYLILRIFRKSVDNFQVSLKSDSNHQYFTLKPIVYIYDCISLSSS